MQSAPLKLAPGSDLRLSIEQFGKEKNTNGFVLGVVGNLSKAVFQCPGLSELTVLEGNLEIITLNGTFTNENVHLHLSLSDSACQVWGGHLEPGTIILKGADVLLGIIDSPNKLQNVDSNYINKNTPRIEIGVINGCPWSSRAIRILNSLNIPHKVLNIQGEDDFNSLKNRSNLSVFPQLFVDGSFVGGYETLSAMHSSGELENFR